MTIDIWHLKYKVLKVNGSPYNKQDDMIREHRENMPRLLKESAAKLADRFDFALVEVTGKCVNTGETFVGRFEADTGMQEDWQVGRQ